MSRGLEVAAFGPVSVAARAFRARSQTFVTAIVKATVALAQDAAMQIAKPAPIVWHEQHRSELPLASVRRPSDVALLVPRPEIVVDGVAFTGPRPAPRIVTRLAVARGTTMLLSKHLEIIGDRRATPNREPDPPAPFHRMPIVYERAYGGLGRAENPAGTGTELDGQGRASLPNVIAGEGTKVEPAGYGAISSGWPLRRQRRGEQRADIDDAAFIELEPTFDETYFQSAPLDQQVDEWRAGDLVVMTNLHPEYSTLRVHFPDLRGVALVETLSGSRTPIALRPDVLFVEPHMLRAEIVFRGALVVPADQLDGIHLSGSVEESDATIDWPATRGGSAAISGGTLELRAEAKPRAGLGSTLVMEDAPPRPGAKKATNEGAGLGSTLVMEPEPSTVEAPRTKVPTLEIDRGAAPPSMPFRRSSTPSAHPSSEAEGEDVPGAPWSPIGASDTRPARSDLSSTLVIDEPTAISDAPVAGVRHAPAVPVHEPAPVTERAPEPASEQPPAEAPEARPPRAKTKVWREDPAASERSTAPAPRVPERREDARAPLYKRFKP